MNPMASQSTAPVIAYCREKQNLLQKVAYCISEVVAAQNEQLQALIKGQDFDELAVRIQQALREKEAAIQALKTHAKSHGC